MHKAPSSDPRMAYQLDGVKYLDQIIKLFGGYKKRSLEMLEPFPGMRALDAGCGTGEDARILAGIAGPVGRVLGLDNSAEMLAVARQRSAVGEAIPEFVQGDICRIDCQDAAFDRVRADRVLQHIAEPELALDELIRVTTPGGLMVVTDVDWGTLVVDGDPPELTRRILAHHFSRHVNGAAGRSLYGLFKHAGLEAVEITSEAFTVTDAELAFFLWGLDAAARDAADKGLIGGDEAIDWIADLDERSRQGAFFSAVTGFGVRGRKPA